MPSESNEPNDTNDNLRILQADISMASKAGDRALATKLTMQYADAILNRGTPAKPALDVDEIKHDPPQ